MNNELVYKSYKVRKLAAVSLVHLVVHDNSVAQCEQGNILNILSISIDHCLKKQNI